MSARRLRDSARAGAGIGAGSLVAYLLVLLAYQRAQEEQADRAGVRFLTMTGQSAKGMYDTFKRFADESLYSTRFAKPFPRGNFCMPMSRTSALESQ